MSYLMAFVHLEYVGVHHVAHSSLVSPGESATLPLALLLVLQSTGMTLRVRTIKTFLFLNVT